MRNRTSRPRDYRASKSKGKIVLISMATSALMLGTSVSSWAASYKPINLNIPTQLPQAVHGKSYVYSFASRVTGGTGKPYVWKFTGTLPSKVSFNKSSGQLLGTISLAAKLGDYPLRVCVTGGKKGSVSSIRNTVCKSTKLRVTEKTGITVPLASGSSGIYSGSINYPNLNPSGITGCEAQIINRTVTLVEGANGSITGSTNNEKLTSLTGSRSGSSITVTLQSVWGARGPYVWQWSGDTISGTLPAFCWDIASNTLLNEGSYLFNLSRSGSQIFSLTVTKNGDGQGSVNASSGSLACGTTCQGQYTAGQSVTLNAAPTSGSVFSGWSGACTGIGSCLLTLNSDKSVVATFVASSSGTYAGNINYPNLNPSGITGCEAQVIERTITLVESAGGVITGTTNNSKTTSLSGTRAGSAVTVTLQTTWGARGPYIWQWTGSTLTGSFPAFCWNTSTMALLNEGSYQFTLVKR